MQWTACRWIRPWNQLHLQKHLLTVLLDQGSYFYFECGRILKDKTGSLSSVLPWYKLFLWDKPHGGAKQVPFHILSPSEQFYPTLWMKRTWAFPLPELSRRGQNVECRISHLIQKQIEFLKSFLFKTISVSHTHTHSFCLGWNKHQNPGFQSSRKLCNTNLGTSFSGLLGSWNKSAALILTLFSGSL